MESIVAVVYSLIGLYTFVMSWAVVEHHARRLGVSSTYRGPLVWVTVILGSVFWPLVYLSYLYGDVKKLEERECEHG